MWVKGVRTEEEIEIYWKPRTHYEAGFVTTFDFNGDVESRVPGADMVWGDEWKLCGAIEMTDEMVLLAGLENFEAFADALMRHAVRLIVCGFGDDPEEVIEMFSPFDDRAFAVEGEYVVVGSHGEIQDLVGSRIAVSVDDDGAMSGEVMVRDASFEIDVGDPAMFVSFLIATKLV